MKKYLTIIAIFVMLFSANLVFAENDNDTENIGGKGVESLLDSTNLLENPFAGQKQITDEEFQKTVGRLKAKKNKKQIKKEKKQGDTFSDEDGSEYIKETSGKNLILSLPVELINGDGTEIPVGHYKVLGKKEGELTYLNFYQAHSLIAKIPAIETENDFDEKEINFIKLVPYNDERIKIIYGSFDFNAYTFVKLKNKITD